MLYVVGYKQVDNHDGLKNGLENDNQLINIIIYLQLNLPLKYFYMKVKIFYWIPNGTQV